MLLPIDEKLENWIEIAVQFKMSKKRFDQGLYKISMIDTIPVYPKILGRATIEEICNLIRPSVLWMDKRGFGKEDIAEKVGEVYGINPEHAKVLVGRILGEPESKEVEEVKV